MTLSSTYIIFLSIYNHDSLFILYLISTLSVYFSIHSPLFISFICIFVCPCYIFVCVFVCPFLCLCMCFCLSMLMSLYVYAQIKDSFFDFPFSSCPRVVTYVTSRLDLEPRFNKTNYNCKM